MGTKLRAARQAAVLAFYRRWYAVAWVVAIVWTMTLAPPGKPLVALAGTVAIFWVAWVLKRALVRLEARLIAHRIRPLIARAAHGLRCGKPPDGEG